MIKNQLRLIFRHLAKQRLNTTVHIVGLTLGITVCILIGLFLKNELDFDKYSIKNDRIYRVNSIWKEANETFELYASPLPLAAALRNDVSGIEKVALIRSQFGSSIEISKDKIFKQEHVLIAEPEFLDLFTVELISGNPEKTLRTPYEAILTLSAARKFFGNEDALGKTFKFRGKYEITVGSVIQDFPSNTHLPASILLSYENNAEFLENGDMWFFGDGEWNKPAANTYVALNPGTDKMIIERQLSDLANKNINSSGGVIRGNFELQAVRDIHFDTERFGGGPWVPAVSKNWLLFFGGIGLAVLLLACINFVNLSTAQSVIRTKEVGVRKSVGAKRSQLVFQFLSEALVITFLSGFIAVIFAKITLPFLNEILKKEIEFDLLQSPEVFIALILFVVLTGMMAGIYPAWIIARLNPIKALKSGTSGSRVDSAKWIRKALVILQFAISFGLLVSVLVISKQVEFMRNVELGFQKENIINIEFSDRKRMEIFRNELLLVQGVEQVSFIKTPPMSDDHWWNTISKTSGADRHSVCTLYGDEHFYDVYNFKLLSGRIPGYSSSLNEKSKIEGNQIVVNEKLLKELGLGAPQDAIGKKIWWGVDSEIVGVVKNFNVEPLKYEIPATLIFQDTAVYKLASIRLQKGVNSTNVLENVRKIWKREFPNEVFEFSFFDIQLNSFYDTESRIYSLFKIFAIVAILISCLGLWGLIAFTSYQRTKEIGVRKVLGASVNSIVLLFVGNIIKMLILAFAVSSPIVYYLLFQWLKNFAYKIDLEILTFVAASGIIVLVSLLTVSFQSIKASLVNPVLSLKQE